MSPIAGKKPKARKPSSTAKCEASRRACKRLTSCRPSFRSHDHLETIRQAEIDRVRGRLGALSPDQELAVEALTRGIINKIMHTPISALKTAARDRSQPRSSNWCGACSISQRKRSAKGLPSQPAIRESKLMARLRIGSRGSQLALWQANHISDLLREHGHEVELEIIKTTGDKITRRGARQSWHQGHVHQGNRRGPGRESRRPRGA